MSLERRKRYSERNGYKPFSDTLIFKAIPITLQNALCSCFDRLYSFIRANFYGEGYYYDLQRHIWTKYLNKREYDFSRENVIPHYLENAGYKWYEKFDIIEEALYFLRKNEHLQINGKPVCFDYLKNDLNAEFERLNVGHRVVDDCITDIVSEIEIVSIETAVAHNDDQVREHFENAIMLYSQRPEPDYRNSIKESISAIEAYCRKKTGEITLGKALKKLESVGINFHPKMKTAFEQLYAYTNDGDTGIRHALIEGESIPTHAEALFILVSCTAFVNYLEDQIVVI